MISEGATLNGKYRILRELGRGGMATVFPKSHAAWRNVMERLLSLAFCRTALVLLASSTVSLTALAQSKPRARDLGVPFVGTPGANNAITDVAGVRVGHTTLIRGEGELRVGEGPVRTGVTVILPRGDDPADPVFSGWFALNGNGEMTGTTWIEESGFLEGPIAITNTKIVTASGEVIENGTVVIEGKRITAD